jgi:hypothetical protein
MMLVTKIKFGDQVIYDSTKEEKTMTKREAMIAMLQEPGKRFTRGYWPKGSYAYLGDNRFVYCSVCGTESSSDLNCHSYEGWMPYEEPVTFDWSCLPAWMDWIAMDDDDEWYAYPGMPSQSKRLSYWDGDKDLLIPEDYAPKGYTGDWKDSLMQRPEGK